MLPKLLTFGSHSREPSVVRARIQLTSQLAIESVTLPLGKGFTGLLGRVEPGRPPGEARGHGVLPLQIRRWDGRWHRFVGVLRPSARLANISGIFPSTFEVSGSMRVSEAAEYGAWAQGLSDRVFLGAARDALRLVGLSDLAGSH